jgi:hypothetical protein
MVVEQSSHDVSHGTISVFLWTDWDKFRNNLRTSRFNVSGNFTIFLSLSVVSIFLSFITFVTFSPSILPPSSSCGVIERHETGTNTFHHQQCFLFHFNAKKYLAELYKLQMAVLPYEHSLHEKECFSGMKALKLGSFVLP